MANNKWMAAVGVGALVGLSAMGVMPRAVAQEKHGGNGVTKAEAQLIPTTRKRAR